MASAASSSSTRSTPCHLLVGVAWALLAGGARRGLAANLAGLALSTAYLGWGVAAQQHVEGLARASLAKQGIASQRLLVTPTAFNSLLWRVLVVDGDSYLEGFHSLLDATPGISFDRFDRGMALSEPLHDLDAVRRIAAFSRGFYSFGENEGELRITDLRMGQEPHYIFRFAVADRNSPLLPLDPPRQVGGRPDAGPFLSWLWQRALGRPLPPPR